MLFHCPYPDLEAYFEAASSLIHFVGLLPFYVIHFVIWQFRNFCCESCIFYSSFCSCMFSWKFCCWLWKSWVLLDVTDLSGPLNASGVSVCISGLLPVFRVVSLQCVIRFIMGSSNSSWAASSFPVHSISMRDTAPKTFISSRVQFVGSPLHYLGRLNKSSNSS